MLTPLKSILTRTQPLQAEMTGAIQIIDVTNPDMPSYAGYSVGGAGSEVLGGANDVDTFEIGTDTYAIVASEDDDGFQIIKISGPSTLSFKGNSTDDIGGYTELLGASGVKTFEIGTDT